ncbi:FG-GAP repeat domain-containing protein [Polyangium fumosum]|uniref:VCBS repeat-containing protein n=1 Tax=Polyangium fumosum TaxID=889272 RepID=A0A4U1IYP4_9BACT|nr:VCBS repeat-containing protein [Polyangium fumosum]TKC99795.1 VCBS repeat-containing protein [Polyangium fumosum]
MRGMQLMGYRVRAGLLVLGMVTGCAPEEHEANGPSGAVKQGPGAETDGEPQSATSGMKPMSTSKVPGYPQSMVARDFNGDDKLDIAAIVCETVADATDMSGWGECSWADCSVITLFGNGDGTFEEPPVALPLGSYRTYRDLEAGDFDGDGNQDLIALAGPDGFAVAFWHGFGGKEVPFGAPVETIGCSTWTDQDWLLSWGDNWTPDMVRPWLPVPGKFGNDAATDVLVFGAECDAFVLEHGKNVVGSIDDSSWFLSLGMPSAAVVAGDFCEDGTSDLIFGGQLHCGVVGDPFQFALSDSYDPFGNRVHPSDEPWVTSYEPETRLLLTTDLNGDGHLDLVGLLGYIDGPQHIATFRGNGEGTFFSSARLDVGEATQWTWPQLQTGDFDGNGNADVVYLFEAEPSRHVIVVLLGDGQGKLVNHGKIVYPSESHVNAVGDFDGDHVTDIALAYGWGISTVAGSTLVSAAKH